jgi:predicted nucleotidyltransferase
MLVAAGLLLMFVFLEIFTIGVYFLPAAGSMATAALLAAPASMAKRRREVEQVIERIREWASVRPDIRAVAIVGSWSRGTPRPDSDLDLVVLTSAQDGYIEGDEWAAGLGVPTGTRRWGRVTERRLRTRRGLELDVGFTDPGWQPIEDIRWIYGRDDPSAAPRSQG